MLSGNSGPAISRDGRLIAYVASDASGVARLYLRPLDRFESTAVPPFVASPFSKVAGQLSPDGKAVAYASDETGRDEIYLRSVAHPDEVATVSADGGRSPKWSPDGKEIFYRRGDAFLAATVASTGKLSVGESRKLFDLRAALGTSTQQAGYSVSPDSQRLLVQLPDPRAIPTRFNVVLNWFEELKAKAPAR